VGDEVEDLAAALAGASDDLPRVGLVTRDDDRIGYRVIELGGGPPAVRALHEELLDASLEPSSLRFHPDPEVVEAAVRERTAVAGWLLPPTTPDRIREVVERGERLPQKSTFFWPKPRTGMVMMPLDPARSQISPSVPAPTHRDRAS
jgi:hypothetical protein